MNESQFQNEKLNIPKQNEINSAQEFLAKIESAENSPILDMLWQFENNFYILMGKFGTPEKFSQSPDYQNERKQEFIKFVLTLDEKMIDQFVKNPELIPAYFKKRADKYLQLDGTNPNISYYEGDFCKAIFFKYMVRGLNFDDAQSLLQDCIRAKFGDLRLNIVDKTYDTVVIETVEQNTKNGEEPNYKNIPKEQISQKLNEIFGGVNENQIYDLSHSTLKWWLKHLDELPDAQCNIKEFMNSIYLLNKYINDVKRIDPEDYEKRSELSKKLVSYGTMYHLWINALQESSIFNFEYHKKIINFIIDPKNRAYFKSKFNLGDSVFEKYKELLQQSNI